MLVREDGKLRVAAITHLQHVTRRSRGDAPHIPAAVLRAYVAALDDRGGAAGDDTRPDLRLPADPGADEL